MQRHSENGVVLVNVLVVLAIASGMMLLLANSQDNAIDRISRSADASVSEQIALGAEASVIDALRRDLDDAPDIDHLNEDWAKSVIQDEVDLPAGSFSVKITDLQAKFDINQLASKTSGTQEFARRLMISVDQPADVANQIARILGVIGRISDIRELLKFGISEETIDALEPYVTALPVEGTINLNSVDQFLLSIMLQNQAQARQVIRLREGKGHVSVSSLRDAGILRPQNSGFTSNVYLVEIFAESGPARISMRTILIRRNQPGVKAVEIFERRFLYPSLQTATEK